MTKTQVSRMTAKWKLVVNEYEKVKSNRSENFSSVDQICQAYQVHRKDIRKYYERWVKAGKREESLLPQRRGPRIGVYRAISKEQERWLIQINRRLGANPIEMVEMVKPYIEAPPSVRTIYRIMRRYPLNERRKKLIKRYEKQYPGEMVHADTKLLPKTLTVDRKGYRLFGAIDDCTRLAYVELIDKADAATVSKACVRGVKWFLSHGVRTEVVMTDNGSEFTSYTSQKARKTHFFETMLTMFDVRHVYTPPHHPQTNGKIERLWRTIQEECIRLINRTLSKEELDQEIRRFMYRYNYERRHGGMDYIVPIDKLLKIAQMLPKL